MVEERRSVCRICAAACGIVVSVDAADGDERVVAVRGDADHPVSRGYTCPKGRALPQLHHHPRRLDAPQVDGTPTTWDAALADLASRLRTIVDAHGADAVGGYFGTGLAYDPAGWMAASGWLAAIGSRRLYTPATVDNAPVLLAAERVAGQPQANPVLDVDRARLVLVVGSNPVVSHGYGTAMADPVRRLRQVRARGGTVWVLDPRRTETAALADHHLPVLPGSDALVLAWLVRERLAAPLSSAALDATDADERAALADAVEPATTERAAAAAGVEIGALHALRDALLAADGAVAAWCGTGVTMSRDGAVAEWLRWALLALTSSLDTPDGMHFRRGALFPMRVLRPPGPGAAGRARTAEPARPATSRPELRHWLGQEPVVALADDIRAGHVRALVVVGANPLTAFPEPRATRDALGALSVLAVGDVVAHDLTDMATHTLAVASQLERSDVPMNELVAERNGAWFTPAVVTRAPERRPAWWVFAELTRRMTGGDLFGARPDDLDDDDVLDLLAARGRIAVADVRAAGSHGITLDNEVGWVRETLLAGGPWRLGDATMLDRIRTLAPPPHAALPLRMIPRRRTRANNSVPHPVDGDREPLLVVHPDDARAAAVDDGELVALRNERGDQVAVPVRVDPRVRRGVAAMTHGELAANAGTLVDAHDGVDPLTGMPTASGVPVVLARPDAEPATS